MKSPDPNNFFSKQDISLTEAIEAKRPTPPWLKERDMKLKAVKPGPLTVKKPAKRKWLYILLAPLLLIHWAAVLFFNVWEIITDSIKEITLALENYIDAQTEPPFIPPAD